MHRFRYRFLSDSQDYLTIFFSGLCVLREDTGTVSIEATKRIVPRFVFLPREEPLAGPK